MDRMSVLYQSGLFNEACRGMTEAEFKEYCTEQFGEDLDVNATVRVNKKAGGQTFVVSTEVLNGAQTPVARILRQIKTARQAHEDRAHAQDSLQQENNRNLARAIRAERLAEQRAEQLQALLDRTTGAYKALAADAERLGLLASTGEMMLKRALIVKSKQRYIMLTFAKRAERDLARWTSMSAAYHQWDEYRLAASPSEMQYMADTHSFTTAVISELQWAEWSAYKAGNAFAHDITLEHRQRVRCLKQVEQPVWEKIYNLAHQQQVYKDRRLQEGHDVDAEFK